MRLDGNFQTLLTPPRFVPSKVITGRSDAYIAISIQCRTHVCDEPKLWADGGKARRHEMQAKAASGPAGLHQSRNMSLTPLRSPSALRYGAIRAIRFVHIMYAVDSEPVHSTYILQRDGLELPVLAMIICHGHTIVRAN